MKITGARVPNNPSEIAGTLQEQVDRCLSDGATDLEVPSTSTPYKVLVQKLESLGLVKPTGKARKSTASVSSDGAGLSAAHRLQVFL